MKKSLSIILIGLAAVVLTAFMPAGKTVTKEGDMTVVNTTEIGKDIEGFNGATPVRIYIRKNKIVKIEALPNQETPQYFGLAKTLLKKFAGKNVSKARQMKVDGITGATYSSDALLENVSRGLKYYEGLGRKK